MMWVLGLSMDRSGLSLDWLSHPQLVLAIRVGGEGGPLARLGREPEGKILADLENGQEGVAICRLDANTRFSLVEWVD